MKALRVILLAGFVAGAIDLIYVLPFCAVRGIAPTRVLQFIASGLLGRDSFNGGSTTAALGFVLEFVISTGMAAVYFLASRKLPILVRHAVICGIAYGAGAYAFMHLVVLPLSAAPKSKPAPIAMATDFMVHLFGIGLPIALITRRFTKRSGLT
ncbi:MAG: DUF1440 domain-containing protein [Verrucomicrobiota bacterium]|nr:DUF1440 domain-containing protein [Verrucomicrobiota bacterium]MDQ6940273.1 DUF1440 domain-containing protein [Verrucomicrobiota bacterium]